MNYGRKNTGSIHSGNMTKDEVAHYLSIEYLGIELARAETSRFEVPMEAQRSFFDRLFRREPIPPFYSQLIQTEAQVIDEMKTLARYCKEKLGNSVGILKLVVLGI